MPATLPQDVLEIVFRYIKEDPYHQLCLVSRAFCNVGRRFRYRQPLSNKQLAPQALVQLAETLRVNQPYLGKLVIDLSGADAAYLSLRQAEETVGPISFQFRGISKALSWQLSVFSSCPNCRELSATYSTEDELKKLVRPVSTSLPALRHIQLVDSSRVGHAVCALALSADLQILKQVSSVKIDGVGLEYPSMRQDPQLSLSLQKLTVDDPDAPLSSFLMFLPIDAS